MLAYIKNLLYLCSDKGKRKEKIMEAIQYKTEEERLAALRRMVGMRKVFEARVREIWANKQQQTVIAQ